MKILKKIGVGLALAASIAFLVAPLSLTVLESGCTQNQQRATYNSLITVHEATDNAYQQYTALVLQGQVATNGVPAAARDYEEFQLAYNLALAVAKGNSNAPAPASVNAASTKVLTTIGLVK